MTTEKMREKGDENSGRRPEKVKFREHRTDQCSSHLRCGQNRKGCRSDNCPKQEIRTEPTAEKEPQRRTNDWTPVIFARCRRGLRLRHVRNLPRAPLLCKGHRVEPEFVGLNDWASK